MTSPKRVLLIDDDRQIVEAIGIRIKAAGYDVVTACDGLAGVATARSLRPDMIVLDLHLPKMDGIEVLSKLHQEEETKGIPVIVVSASAVDQNQALERGARYFLEKPYDAKKLIEAVDSAIAEAAAIGS